jgi:hypothetical protein
VIDSFRALSHPVVPANMAGTKQYSGINHADDGNNASFLAELEFQLGGMK